MTYLASRCGLRRRRPRSKTVSSAEADEVAEAADHGDEVEGGEGEDVGAGDDAGEGEVDVGVALDGAG